MLKPEGVPRVQVAPSRAGTHRLEGLDAERRPDHARHAQVARRRGLGRADEQG